MTINLDELVARVQRAVAQDVYDTNDITFLLNIALGQQDAIKRLADDNERLTKALASAGEHITKLERLEPLTHLVQYAEENNV